METVLFITNGVFINDQYAEGGVRFCTDDYLKLIRSRYNVELFPITYNRSFFYRFKAKIGLDVFEDYNEADYKERLLATIARLNISKVFINLSSATDVARVLKTALGNRVSTVLCSHGIEAGDYLHQSVRFNQLMPVIQRLNAPVKIGRTLQKEVIYRSKYLDLVLTVSEVEEAIERWLGAAEVFMIPRVFTPDFIDWKPIAGRLGFVADMSHFPNYNGVQQLCTAIQAAGMQNSMSIRIAGKPCANLERLCNDFSFIQPLGFLDNDALRMEAGTWMYYLNLVFYYSKGVSTKLTKGMNWGLPVISTTAGNRGYYFREGGVITLDQPEAIVQFVALRLQDMSLLQQDKTNVEKAVNAFDDYTLVMEPIHQYLQRIRINIP